MIVADNLAGIFNQSADQEMLRAIQEYLNLGKNYAGMDHGFKETLPNGVSVIYLNANSGAQNKNLLEAHREFRDLHHTIHGTDSIAYKPVDQCTHVNKPYTTEGDYLLYDEAPSETLSVTAGQFCLIPNEFAHMALYEDHGLVSKLVFKLPA